MSLEAAAHHLTDRFPSFSPVGFNEPAPTEAEHEALRLENPAEHIKLH